MKKIIAYIMILFMTIIAVSATKDFNINETEAYTNITTEENIEFTIFINNTGNEDTGIIILEETVLDGPYDYEITLEQKNLQSINNQSSRTETLNYAVLNSNQYAGDYTGTITGYLLENDTKTDDLDVKITVEENIMVETDSTFPTIAKGQSGQIELEIENKGNKEVNVAGSLSSIQKETDPSQIIILNGCSVNQEIDYEDTLTIICTFDVLSSVDTGIYSGEFEIAYGSEIVTEELKVNVKSDDPSIVASETHTINTVNNQNSVSSDFTIKNDAYVSDSVSISDFEVYNGENVISIDVLPNSKTIPAQNESIFTLQFNPSGKEAGIYRGNFTIESNDEPINVDVTITVTNPVSSVSFPEIIVGSTSQQREVTLQNKEFTIKNDGDTTLTGIELTNNIPSKYEFEIVGGMKSTLSKGETMTVLYNIYVPFDQDS
ncbi:MAG: hypothetical protein ACOC2W_03000, partial [bacterium]